MSPKEDTPKPTPPAPEPTLPLRRMLKKAVEYYAEPAPEDTLTRMPEEFAEQMSQYEPAPEADAVRSWWIEYEQNADSSKSDTQISGPPLKPGERFYVVERIAYERVVREVAHLKECLKVCEQTALNDLRNVKEERARSAKLVEALRKCAKGCYISHNESQICEAQDIARTAIREWEDGSK